MFLQKKNLEEGLKTSVKHNIFITAKLYFFLQCLKKLHKPSVNYELIQRMSQNDFFLTNPLTIEPVQKKITYTYCKILKSEVSNTNYINNKITAPLLSTQKIL